MNKRLGEQTVIFENPPSIISVASTVGPKEGQGPLKDKFDVVLEDVLAGEDTWEKAESRIINDNFKLAVEKANLSMEDMDYILTGDLLNQDSGSTFGIRDLKRPFFGLFGACSTMGESMALSAMLIDGGFANYILAGASSHFCSAEKQFRFPLELGTQRPPSATWTVTGDGAVVISSKKESPVVITGVTTGKIIDMGIKDAANMGAAMAPAAVDTLVTHFKDTGTKPSDYDVIATGDLGYIGHELVVRLMKEEGYDMGSGFTDCGIEIFDQKTQDTHSGGSGCACSAVTFCAYFYEKIKRGEIKKMLFIPTGALMSPTSSQQGETIPSIAHLVVLENRR